jgi:ABC-type phosphate transport system auxiliary subunit
MSKALYGHLGASDAALVAEVARLRRRVAELEEQLAGLEAEAHVVTLRDSDLDAALRELGQPALT